MKKTFVILSLLLITISFSFSQEIITQLSTNPQLKGQYRIKHKLKATTVSVKLPFVDDFSNCG